MGVLPLWVAPADRKHLVALGGEIFDHAIMVGQIIGVEFIDLRRNNN